MGAWADLVDLVIVGDVRGVVAETVFLVIFLVQFEAGFELRDGVLAHAGNQQ